MKLKDFINEKNQTAIASITKHPVLLTFLPIVYIAWSDAELSISEIAFIRTKIQGMDWLTTAEKAILRNWFDGQNPPNKDTLTHFGELVRKIAATIPLSSKKSLAKLGTQIVRISHRSDHERGRILSSPSRLKDYLPKYYI